MKLKIINLVIQVVYRLLTYLGKPVQEEPVTEPKIHSVTRQDIDTLQKAFPLYTYKPGTPMEGVALGTVRSDGEQRVINFLLSRMKGRIGQGITYD